MTILVEHTAPPPFFVVSKKIIFKTYGKKMSSKSRGSWKFSTGPDALDPFKKFAQSPSSESSVQSDKIAHD